MNENILGKQERKYIFNNILFFFETLEVILHFLLKAPPGDKQLLIKILSLHFPS